MSDPNRAATASYQNSKKYAGWKGIQVRIPPALHKELQHRAIDDEVTLIEILTAGVFAYLDEKLEVGDAEKRLTEWTDLE